jgi:hypothetical protein
MELHTELHGGECSVLVSCECIPGERTRSTHGIGGDVPPEPVLMLWRRETYLSNAGNPKSSVLQPEDYSLYLQSYRYPLYCIRSF